jgi:hypothetical protein
MPGFVADTPKRYLLFARLALSDAVEFLPAKHSGARREERWSTTIEHERGRDN